MSGRGQRRTELWASKIRESKRCPTYHCHAYLKPITPAVEPAIARRREVMSYPKMTRSGCRAPCRAFENFPPNRMIETHVPLVTQSQVTEQWRTCQCLKGPPNSHGRYVKIQAKLPREICYLIATAEDIFTRINIDYEFLCNSPSVGGIENHQDKSSSVGDIENCQDKVGGTENHQNKSAVGDMKTTH